MTKLFKLMLLPYDDSVKQLVTTKHYSKRDSLIASLLDDPCLARYNSLFRCYLLTDFSFMALVTLCVNQILMTLLRPPWRVRLLARPVNFFSQRASFGYALSVLALAAPGEMRNGCTRTLVRPSPATGPLIKIVIASGRLASLGSRTATPSVLSYLMTGPPPSFYASKCASCSGLSISSIAKENGWLR